MANLPHPPRNGQEPYPKWTVLVRDRTNVNPAKRTCGELINYNLWSSSARLDFLRVNYTIFLALLSASRRQRLAVDSETRQALAVLRATLLRDRSHCGKARAVGFRRHGVSKRSHGHTQIAPAFATAAADNFNLTIKDLSLLSQRVQLVLQSFSVNSCPATRPDLTNFFAPTFSATAWRSCSSGISLHFHARSPVIPFQLRQSTSCCRRSVTGE